MLSLLGIPFTFFKMWAVPYNWINSCATLPHFWEQVCKLKVATTVETPGSESTWKPSTLSGGSWQESSAVLLLKTLSVARLKQCQHRKAVWFENFFSLFATERDVGTIIFQTTRKLHGHEMEMQSVPTELFFNLKLMMGALDGCSLWL